MTLETGELNVKPGKRLSQLITLSPEILSGFAKLTGDRNPLHTDAEFASTTRFGRPIAHGYLLGILAERAGAALFPAGWRVVSHQTKFLAPAVSGEQFTVEALLTELNQGSREADVAVKIARALDQKVIVTTSLKLRQIRAP